MSYRGAATAGPPGGGKGGPLTPPPPAHAAAFSPAVPADTDFKLEPAYGAISLGAHARPLSVELQVAPKAANSSASLGDLTFLPVFRPDDNTASDRWCPGFSLARALLLAGRPAAALARIPPLQDGLLPYAEAPEHVGCGVAANSTDLRRIARLEAGSPRDLKDNSVEDARQNLWRWAGNYG